MGGVARTEAPWHSADWRAHCTAHHDTYSGTDSAANAPTDTIANAATAAAISSLATAGVD